MSINNGNNDYFTDLIFLKKKLVTNWGYSFFETSSKTGENIDQAVVAMTDKLAGKKGYDKRGREEESKERGQRERAKRESKERERAESKKRAKKEKRERREDGRRSTDNCF